MSDCHPFLKHPHLCPLNKGSNAVFTVRERSTHSAGDLMINFVSPGSPFITHVKFTSWITHC